jgi:glycine dehydrogenase subunit 1
MESHIEIVFVDYEKSTGQLNLSDLEAKISDKTAAIYFECPSYFGVIESQGENISELARANGAETIVGVDPISLGLLKPPSDYGADITVGTTQTLGVHMNTGGGVGGFISSRDEEKYVLEYNTLNISITETQTEGEFGFGLSCAHQTSYGMREEGKDWTNFSIAVSAIWISWSTLPELIPIAPTTRSSRITGTPPPTIVNSPPSNVLIPNPRAPGWATDASSDVFT